ncbi:hypothetical protein GCM10023185_23970 [Hymenobacter saemangeumensis]|uniref:Outer membrane protein beta-barrel domain-containing protein n=1 Tax=Hymenobacter saemangeumensis TaxID=1084522 RepID=A0ABP8IH60_9BACT
MKNLLFPLLTASTMLLAGTALAQDKPALNTAPPGTATPPPAQQPAQPPVQQTAPAPGAAPLPAPTTDKPSGLDLPSNRDARAAGGSSSELSRKLFIYSNFGLGFNAVNGISQFNFSIAPALGYRISERFALGPGISYSYLNYSVPDNFVIRGTNSNSISTSNIGVKAFAQYIFYKEFFAHAEYELTRAELLAEDASGNLSKIRKMIGTPLLGAGYRQQFSERAAADIVLLYNFDNTLYSLYSNPVFRFSFLFNLGR